MCSPPLLPASELRNSAVADWLSTPGQCASPGRACCLRDLDPACAEVFRNELVDLVWLGHPVAVGDFIALLGPRQIVRVGADRPYFQCPVAVSFAEVERSLPLVDSLDLLGVQPVPVVRCGAGHPELSMQLGLVELVSAGLVVHWWNWIVRVGIWVRSLAHSDRCQEAV